MSANATRCRVCGGPFAEKRVIIDGQAYHELCSYMSYPPHTYEDYARLSDRNADLVAAIQRIDAINDRPECCFNSEISDICDSILRPDITTATTPP